MTRIFKRTIPTSYLRIDSTVTGADAYMNVRDIQRWMLNHNILVARRIRRPIFALNQIDAPYTLGATSRTAPSYGCFQEIQHGSLDPYLSVPIHISPWVRQLELVIDGTATTGTVHVYPEISCEEVAGVASSSYVADVTTTPGRFRVTIDLPNKMYTGKAKEAWFKLSVVAVMNGTDLAVTDENVIEVGSNWIITDATSPNATVGSVMYCTTNALVHPRTVIAAEDLGSQSKMTFNIPFAPGEMSTTSDVNYQNTYLFNPNYIGLYELGVSGFNADAEPPNPE